jgi:hypothetical protein
MTAEKILFTTEIELNPSDFPSAVAVKGQLPRLDYSFTLSDIYSVIPALNTQQAYKKIVEEFKRVDILLSEKLELKRSLEFPPARNDVQALYFLSALFNPASYCVDRVMPNLERNAAVPVELLRLKGVRPFPLRLATPQKLMHTLLWIDTNIKVSVEDLTIPRKVIAQTVRQIVEAVFKIYSLLVKQDNYFIARSINFNYSMFLQDRILQLLFGNAVFMNSDVLNRPGELANSMALQLLKGFHGLSYRQLCTLSVFMGLIWISSKDLQQAYNANPDEALGKIETQLKSMQANWGIDHIDLFLRDMEADSQPLTVAVVLDDNGESVFDIALFQRLLDDSGLLRVIFVVNQYQISNNIALRTFQVLLGDSYFANLRHHFDRGRAEIYLEWQMFRSFDLEYLQPKTRRAFETSEITYIKGANFFETLQVTQNIRYYCFTVHGQTSMLLTGCAEGKGVFARLEGGSTGYTYHSPGKVETLVDKIKKTEGESIDT